jgi:DNA-binding NtrC family response regulator
LRADLYYRLSTVTIEIPPLRERPEDILPLAQRFLEQLSREFARPPARLTESAEQALMKHSWPGNVRELRNAVERALMLSDDDAIDERLILPPPRSPSASAIPAARRSPGSTGEAASLADVKHLAHEAVEREHIKQALESSGGSRSGAAKLLGMSRTTLWEKVKRYGLT